MSGADGLFAVLAALIVVMAGYAVFGRGHFAAVVGFVVYGLLLSLAWMVLAAPDVAITEAAVGGGVTGALLLMAYVRMKHKKMVALPPWWVRFTALLLSGMVTTGLIFVVLTLPSPPPTLAPEASASLERTGMGNAVTAVLMSYRALDTMLEKVVLLLAVVAVWALAKDRFWGGRPDFEFPAQKGGPLIFLEQILIPVGVLAGVYLFWVGADKPGGAFAGGALIAAMGVLGFFAGIVSPPQISSLGLRIALVLGIFVFLAVGFAGMVWAGDFLAYPKDWEKPVIVIIEVAMTLSISYTLAMLVAGPPGRKP